MTLHPINHWQVGIEGTISQGVRRFDLRRTRYLGLEKTHLPQLPRLVPSI